MTFYLALRIAIELPLTTKLKNMAVSQRRKSAKIDPVLD